MYNYEYGGLMTALHRTLMRNLRENKSEILAAFERNGSIDYTIQLQEEEGEVLITLLMEEAEIERIINKAISLIFPGSKAENVRIEDNLLTFKIN